MEYKDKKVVIMGLGLHGGGAASALWFFQQGAEVIVTDLKDETALRDSIISLNKATRAYRLAHSEKSFLSVSYVLGRHEEEDFRTVDLIIQNPGVPRESRYLSIARDAGVAIENEVTIFFLHAPHSFKIAVTGTRGKSTTATLIYEMLKRKNSSIYLLGVAGNPASRPFLSALDSVRQAEASSPPPLCVMELSSWQLELFGTSSIKPNIAVITNVFEDHLNRYKNFDEYRETKREIYAYQNKDDFLILNYDNQHTQWFGSQGTAPQLFWFSLSEKSIPQGIFLDQRDIVWKDSSGSNILFRIEREGKGDHMAQNILAACTVAHIVGCTGEHMQDALRNFHGVPSRLEQIGEKEGRIFYDDTTATSPDATIAALQTLSQQPGRKIILIAGGADKNCDFSLLAAAIQKYCHAVILLSGTASPKLASAIAQEGYAHAIEFANSMHEAVSRAWKHSSKGDILLLSPGAASFGMFVNEFDRGSQFRKAFYSLTPQ